MKDIESKADSLAKQADGNCELSSAKNTLNQVEQYAKAEAIRDEAEAKRQQLKNQPIDTVVVPQMNPILIKAPVKKIEEVKKNSLVPKVELPKENFFDEPKKDDSFDKEEEKTSESLDDLADRIIAIAEKMGDTIELDGIVKLKVPANKILAEELQIPESSLGDKLRLMEAKNILTLKPWGGGSKRGRYLES
jgi:N12 class adenine-specific DNA methylase